ncbi:rod shape-determining protein RodA, partial [uncultured Alistipes sp.]|uniref:rod shape-determining protein RodA n=1 Tax=uncultured Alistipes sp. TaxID=538949 RepID=UPI0026EC6E3A
MTGSRHNRIFEGVDPTTVLLYVLIVLAGCASIFAASYEAGSAEPLSFSNFYMKQLVWVGAAWVTALVVLLLDVRFWHMFAYPAYFAGLLLLLAALAVGKEVNGAKAWFEFGSFRVQPAEFVKIATALAVARVMSAYSFSISRPGDLAKVGAVLFMPLAIIVLQNDTGSGIVLGSFLFVLYREGLNKGL